jgi:PAS domain S-box-containing protein
MVLQQQKEQNILLKISQSILGTLDYQNVLQIISDGMSELLEIETAAIYLVEKENELYLGATTPALDPSMPDHLRNASINDHPHIKQVIENSKAVTIEDTHSVSLSEPEKVVVEIRKLKSLLFLPFIQKSVVLGVLILGTSNKSRTFSESDIELGQTVANQLSIGIQNARLHHDLKLKNHNLEEEIEERRKVMQALKTSEAHLSNALLIAKLGHWEYDVHTDRFTFSDEFYALLGTNANEMNGYYMTSLEYASKFLPQQHRALVGEEIKKAIETNNPGFSSEIEHGIVDANGNDGYINVRYKVQKNEQGQTVKIFGVNQDITKQKQNEQDLLDAKNQIEKSEYLYRNLFDQAAEGIFLMTLDGYITQVNQSFANMHGYSIDEILYENISKFDILGENTFAQRQRIPAELSKGSIVQIEVEHYHRNGSVFPLLVSMQQITVEGKKLILCFHTDLTHQKNVEKELEKHRDKLEELVNEKTVKLDNAIEELKSVNEALIAKNNIIDQQNKDLKKTLSDLQQAQTKLIQSEKMASLGILTAGVAHEINNPLNYIMGSYQALLDYFEGIKCAEHDYIMNLMDKLKTGLDKSTEIVKGLNEFSRDNKSLNENCNLHQIIHSCLTILSNQYKNRITIEQYFSEESIVIKGNVGQLHQVFINILSNSIQAISGEGCIKITSKKRKEHIEIIIEDDGEGILPEHIDKITDPFFTTKDPGKGTGLGLSISYSIIRDHHGSISFESEPGKKTVATITFTLH